MCEIYVYMYIYICIYIRIGHPPEVVAVVGTKNPAVYDLAVGIPPPPPPPCCCNSLGTRGVLAKSSAGEVMLTVAFLETTGRLSAQKRM